MSQFIYFITMLLTYVEWIHGLNCYKCVPEEGFSMDECRTVSRYTLVNVCWYQEGCKTIFLKKNRNKIGIYRACSDKSCEDFLPYEGCKEVVCTTNYCNGGNYTKNYIAIRLGINKQPRPHERSTTTKSTTKRTTKHISVNKYKISKKGPTQTTTTKNVRIKTKTIIPKKSAEAPEVQKDSEEFPDTSEDLEILKEDFLRRPPNFPKVSEKNFEAVTEKQNDAIDIFDMGIDSEEVLEVFKNQVTTTEENTEALPETRKFQFTNIEAMPLKKPEKIEMRKDLENVNLTDLEDNGIHKAKELFQGSEEEIEYKSIEENEESNDIMEEQITKKGEEEEDESSEKPKNIKLPKQLTSEEKGDEEGSENLSISLINSNENDDDKRRALRKHVKTKDNIERNKEEMISNEELNENMVERSPFMFRNENPTVRYPQVKKKLENSDREGRFAGLAPGERENLTLKTRNGSITIKNSFWLIIFSQCLLNIFVIFLF